MAKGFTPLEIQKRPNINLRTKAKPPIGSIFSITKHSGKFLTGFTLLEILIIISVIGVLALGAIPAFRVFQPTVQLSGVTQELVGDLRYIQQITVTEQEEYCLQFFPADKKYQLKKCDGEIIKEKVFPAEIESVSISELANNEIRYNPYGAVKEAGTITLKNTKNEIKIITIKPSGFVSVGEEK